MRVTSPSHPAHTVDPIQKTMDSIYQENIYTTWTTRITLLQNIWNGCLHLHTNCPQQQKRVVFSNNTSYKPIQKIWSPPKHKQIPRQKELRAKKRATKVKEKVLLNIIRAMTARTTNTCICTYGFISNPSLPTWKNTKNVINTFNQDRMNAQPRNLAFHNLCTTKQTPPNTQKLLGLGLKYCMETSITKPNLKHTVNKLIWAICIKAYIQEQQTQDNNYMPRLYTKNTSWDPPPANGTIEHKLFEFASLLESIVTWHCPKKCFNISYEQHKMLQQLKNNPDFIILNTDKNLGPAIMNHQDYITQTHNEHLLTDSYQHFMTEEAISHLQQNKQTLKQYIQDHGKMLSQAELEYFQHSYKQHHRVPMFYSMPKIHKSPFSTRPIISCINSFGAIFST